MIDNEDINVVRYSDFNCVHCSQFKEINCEQVLTPIQSRLYYLMIFGKQPRVEDESLYGWTNRLGIPKSTTYGLFTKGNQNMHLSLANKLAEATGANTDWIQKGIGEPFVEVVEPQEITKKNDQPDGKSGIDSHLLIQAIETAEKALKVANGTMTPEDKAEFITTLFFNSDLSNVNEVLLKACISLIEKALKDTRRILSPTPKSELIIIIYNFYYDKPWTEEHLKSALDQLIRSVS